MPINDPDPSLSMFMVAPATTDIMARTAICGDILDPVLDFILKDAERQGWNPAEVVLSMLKLLGRHGNHLIGQPQTRVLFEMADDALHAGELDAMLTEVPVS